MNELLIIPVCTVCVNGSGEMILMKRFLEGVNAYASRWKGKVTVLIRESAQQGEGLDPVKYNSADYSFSIELLPDEAEALNNRLRQAAIILGTLDIQQIEIGIVCSRYKLPLVWVTETNMQTRMQIIEAQVHNILRRVKRKAMNYLHEYRYRNAIKKSSGLQCNGIPAFSSYQRLNGNNLLFFDSRVTEEMVCSKVEIADKFEILMKGYPLRLAFSGRLTEIKGVNHLPKVAMALRNLNVPFTLDIYGDGNLKAFLQSEIDRFDLSSQVRLCGVLDFETQLNPHFRQSVDLFLCCHPQGDPSCTYLETLASGVPIIGYANEAWQGMYQLSGGGELIEMGNVQQMAECVANIHHHRVVWLGLAQAARDFAAEHRFEKTMDNRIRHLQLSASLSC